MSGKMAILGQLEIGEKKDTILTDKKIVLRILQQIIKDETQIRQDAMSL